MSQSSRRHRQGSDSLSGTLWSSDHRDHVEWISGVHVLHVLYADMLFLQMGLMMKDRFLIDLSIRVLVQHRGAQYWIEIMNRNTIPYSCDSSLISILHVLLDSSTPCSSFYTVGLHCQTPTLMPACQAGRQFVLFNVGHWYDPTGL